MAELADRSRSPATLDWRRKIIEIEPTTENKLQLASAGMRYQGQPFPLTTEILAELPETATNLTAFHLVSAELALRMHRAAVAQAHLETATQLEPTNMALQVNLAVVSLDSTNPAITDTARATLEQFSANTNFSPFALRSLVADRLAHDDLTSAYDYSKRLLTDDRAVLGDHLQHLGILRHLHSAEMAVELKLVQQQSGMNALSVAEVASWMTENGFSGDVADWLAKLPLNIQAQPPVLLAKVDSYMKEEDWAGLRSFVAKGNWGEMDCLRVAFLSRAWDKLGESLVASSNWRAAVGRAGKQFGALTALLELAKRWQLEDARKDLLWQIARKFPRKGGHAGIWSGYIWLRAIHGN